MDRDQQLKFCSVCKNRGYNKTRGIICGLTKELPSFTENCSSYKEDSLAVLRKKIDKAKEKNEEQEQVTIVRRGSYALYFVGTLFIVSGFYEAFFIKNHQLTFGIINWLIAGMFIVFGYLVNFFPFISLLLGTLVYLSLNLITISIDTTNILTGVWLKVIITAYLFYALITSRNLPKKQKKNNSYILDQA
jgi:hypothetical protein